MVICAAGAIKPLGFIPIDQIVSKKGVDKTVMYVAGFFVAIVGSVLLTVVPMFNYNNAVEKKEKLEKSIEELSYIEKICSDYMSYKNTFTALEDMSKATFSNIENINEIISLLETSIPSDTIVHSLTSTNETLILNVTVSSKEEAAKLVSQIEGIEFFDAVTTTGITDSKNEDTGANEVVFSVSCIYADSEVSEDMSEVDDTQKGENN